MKSYFYYETKIGNMFIADNGLAITNMMIEDRIDTANMVLQETSLIKKAYTELCEYLDGKRKVFDFPIEAVGTKFQMSVWDKLREIPYGQTISYKELAAMIGNEKACRAVGMANNKNPIIIAIPCHRVIGSNKKLVGYAAGLDIKRKLLEMESENI